MKLVNLEDAKYEEFFEDGELKNYVSEERLNEMPIIDAEPVKRGEWVDDFVILKYTRPDEIISYKKCSNCGHTQVPADVDVVYSNYDSSFAYRVGEIVSVDNFDTNRWNECAPGIHFFITRQEAVDY